ncbi:MAG TPA: GNAT family N-acetyltransferase [Ignavibacteria bacterium]|nr:GNAT family N-acetyltransferase [Ignavibacteria bacterium]
MTFNENVFDTFPVLETDRLVLRKITENDVGDFFNIYSDPEAMKYFGKIPYSTLAEAEMSVQIIKSAFNNKDGIRWGITLKPYDKLIGSGGFWRIIKNHFRAEIGYDLLPEYWKKGIMTEAINAMSDFAFNKMNLHSIEANVDPENTGSIRLLEKCGFIKEGHFKESYFFNNKFLDSVIYSKVNSGN